MWCICEFVDWRARHLRSSSLSCCFLRCRESCALSLFLASLAVLFVGSSFSKPASSSAPGSPSPIDPLSKAEWWSDPAPDPAGCCIPGGMNSWSGSSAKTSWSIPAAPASQAKGSSMASPSSSRVSDAPSRGGSGSSSMLTAGDAVASCVLDPCSGVPGTAVDLVATESSVNLRVVTAGSVRSRRRWGVDRDDRELGAGT